MRSRLGRLALLFVAVFVVAAGLSSFVLDPENIGGRLALYLVALLGLVGAIVTGIVALVRRRRQKPEG